MKKKWVELEFEIKDVVFLKTDKEQLERIVYSIDITENTVMYWIVQGTTASKHYGFEMSNNKII